VLEDEDINESISTPEMGSWEGIIEVKSQASLTRMRHQVMLKHVRRDRLSARRSSRRRSPTGHAGLSRMGRQPPW
jgi:hypothetical protein